MARKKKEVDAAVEAEKKAAILSFARGTPDVMAVGSCMPIYDETSQTGLNSLINVETALYGDGSGLLENVVGDLYGIRQHSGLDEEGVDLIVAISERFLQKAKQAEAHFFFDELMVQVKSSEIPFQRYWKGEGSSADWKAEGKVALEGEWPFEMIIGDFMIQVIALANGLRDREVGAKMLALFSPEAIAVLAKHILTLEELHGKFYAWLSGVESIDNYGSLAERLGLAV